MYALNNQHRKTLEIIFTDPVSSSLEWRKIEALFVAIGAKITEGKGSRVRVEIKGVIASFHRPHPEKEAKAYQVRDGRKFLEMIGVTPWVL
ncbi:type II toxin-antitoxin system HicA family toxin [Erwinia sp. P7711]|uniref:type II toxin-antitoxin system HicA family toxin n=1 Tax=Erwinia sp. P7711 TaxID=3141451 RepID=UPI00319513B5